MYPQIDQRGGQSFGYVETGFELFAFLVAVLAMLVGFTPEIGRLLSALLFVCSCLMVWSSSARRYGEECGTVAAFLHAFGFPLLLWAERSFMNEALLICLSIGSLLIAQRYLEQRRTRDLALLIVSTSLVGAIKLPYLIVWAPVVGLFLEADDKRAWRWPLGLMMVVNLAVAGAWYSHAHQLAAVTGLSFGMTDKLFDPGYRLLNLVHRGDGLTARQRHSRSCWRRGCPGRPLVRAARETLVRSARRRWIRRVPRAGRRRQLYPRLLPAGCHTRGAVARFVRAGALVDAFAASPEGAERALAATLGAAALATFVRSASAHSWYRVLNRRS